MPVVAPGWSGQMDFLVDGEGKEKFYNISYDLGPVPQEVHWEDVIVEGSMWCYPRETSAKETMRLCYEDIQNNEGFAATADEHAEYLHDRFEETKMYAEFIDAMGIESEPDFDVESWLEGLDVEEIE